MGVILIKWAWYKNFRMLTPLLEILRMLLYTVGVFRGAHLILQSSYFVIIEVAIAWFLCLISVFYPQNPMLLKTMS